jgi:hypothetical protein
MICANKQSGPSARSVYSIIKLKQKDQLRLHQHEGL